MYAIVEIGGHQYKVEKNNEIYVNRLAGDEGSTIELNKVLLLDNNGSVHVGAPVIEGASVKAKIVSHLKSDKVIIFKKKRRKGYKKKNGHRQMITKIQVQEIVEKGGVSAKASKKSEKQTESTEETN